MRMRRLFAFLVAIPLAMLGWTYWSAVADRGAADPRGADLGHPCGMRGVPPRLGAVPEIWLTTLGPAR